MKTFNTFTNLTVNYPGMDSIISEMKKGLYLVRVPQIATYDEAEVELLGVPLDVMRNGDVKNNNFKRYSTVMLSLDRLLDIYSKGFTIRVINREDTLKIAERLSHIAEILERSPNLRNQEIVELINDFLKNVVNYNRVLIEKKVKQDEEKLEEELGLDFFETSPTVVPDYVLNTKVRR